MTIYQRVFNKLFYKRVSEEADKLVKPKKDISEPIYSLIKSIKKNRKDWKFDKDFFTEYGESYEHIQVLDNHSGLHLDIWTPEVNLINEKLCISVGIRCCVDKHSFSDQQIGFRFKIHGISITQDEEDLLSSEMRKYFLKLFRIERIKDLEIARQNERAKRKELAQEQIVRNNLTEKLQESLHNE